MSRRGIVARLVFPLLLLTQLGCQALVDSASPIGAVDSVYTEPGNPIDVSLTLDDATTTGVITPDGGSLSVTASDGATYTLEVPAGALSVATEIRLTPVAEMTGLPFSGGLGAAVRLEPDGLQFSDYVTLTLTPANPIPLEDQILFGFEGDGQDLHLALPGADDGQIQIRLLHFSGAGVARGVSDEKAGVLQRMANRADARLSGEIGAHLQDLRAGRSTDPAAVEAALAEFYNSVVIPRLKAATANASTCADARQAIDTFVSWARLQQLLGPGADGAKIEGVVATYFPTLIKKCLDEEFERCTTKHQIAGMLPTLLGFERLGQLLGALSASNPAEEDAGWVEIRTYGEDLVRRCYQWDLEFESAGTFNADDLSYDSRVAAVVPIRVQGDVMQLQLQGSAPLDSLDFTFTLGELAGQVCNNQSFTGGGTFTAAALGWVHELRRDVDGQDRYFVKDFSLQYDPGQTTESFLIDCVDPKDETPDMQYQSPPTPYWSSLFLVTHYKEVAGSEGQPPAGSLEALLEGIGSGDQAEAYLATAWTVFEAELMGTKEWQGASDLEPTAFEGGGFKLYHRPQP